jgi:tRNA (guanine37-N1)-methyltransferase
LGGLDLAVATAADGPELMVLTRACWVAEIARYGMFGAGEETLHEVVEALGEWTTWTWRSSGRLVASVRVRTSPTDPTLWQIGRLMVAPDLQGRGLGRALLAHAEAQAPAGTAAYWLNTGASSERNLRIHRKAGYRVQPGEGAFPGTVDLVKPRR